MRAAIKLVLAISVAVVMSATAAQASPLPRIHHSGPTAAPVAQGIHKT